MFCLYRIGAKRRLQRTLRRRKEEEEEEGGGSARLCLTSRCWYLYFLLKKSLFVLTPLEEEKKGQAPLTIPLLSPGKRDRKMTTRKKKLLSGERKVSAGMEKTEDRVGGASMTTEPPAAPKLRTAPYAEASTMTVVHVEVSRRTVPRGVLSMTTVPRGVALMTTEVLAEARMTPGVPGEEERMKRRVEREALKRLHVVVRMTKHGSPWSGLVSLWPFSW